MPTKPKKKSAGARMRDAGKSLVWATFTEDEKADIRAAAGIAGKPMSQFVTDSALAAADKILENFRKKRE